MRFGLIFLAMACAGGCTSVVSGDSGPWIALFDGGGLEKFQTIGKAIWRVEDGVILGGQDGDPGRSGLLMTRELFSDFEITLEFMLDEHGKYNSGLYLRHDPASQRCRGYQVNIGRGVAGEYCGGLFMVDWLAKGDEQDGIRKPLAWNTMRVAARGAHIVVDLNGVKVVDYTDPDPEPALLGPGVIAFQTYGAEGHAGWVKFRNVRVRRLG